MLCSKLFKSSVWRNDKHELGIQQDLLDKADKDM